jgi:LssY C-terminus
MTRPLIRLLQRLAILGLGIISVWLIVFVVFDFADQRLPWAVALGVTYAVAAYVVLPRAVRIGLKVLQHRRVPRYTTTGDGLPGDPVNLALFGTLAQLRSAFATAGWLEADRLGFASSWRMARAFVLNSPYPTAPFSTLYLFGRGQDIGFQKAIDDSPRKRHHVRFWALSLEHAASTLGTASLWLNTGRPPQDAQVVWVGAGTKDTGFSLTKLTFQLTHATDADTNLERDHIIAELAKHDAIGDVTSYQAGQQLAVERVNRYVTDGQVTLASLAMSVFPRTASDQGAGDQDSTSGTLGRGTGSPAADA